MPLQHSGLARLAPRPQQPRSISPAAWRRLAVAVVLGTIGSVGMWSVPVALPAVQADFGVARGGCLAALYADDARLRVRRRGDGAAVRPLRHRGAARCAGRSRSALGYVVAGLAPNLVLFALAHVLIGLGASAGFGPLIADMSRWFAAPARDRGRDRLPAGTTSPARSGRPCCSMSSRRRAGARPTSASACSACSPCCRCCWCCGGGAPAHEIETGGRRRRPRTGARHFAERADGRCCVSPGCRCCVAMAMPQVHIVAYCGDLGYGVARGAEMLAMMLGFGIVSRIASGFVADRIGGVATLLLGSALQGAGAAALRVVRRAGVALRDFRAVRPVPGRHRADVRDHRARSIFAPQEAGVRLGIVLMATLFGMAFGGWMSRRDLRPTPAPTGRRLSTGWSGTC